MAALDERLTAIVVALPRTPFSGEAFRHLGPGYSPRSGEGARIQGGRWNPPDSFPVLYLALPKESAIAEFYRRAEREGLPPGDLLPRHLYRYQVQLQAALDLTDATTSEAVGFSEGLVRSDDPILSQAIGDAAHYAGFEGLLAPSATGVGETLAVFPARLQAGSIVDPVDYESWETLPPDPRLATG
jgi:RES domain-containing protein